MTNDYNNNIINYIVLSSPEKLYLIYPSNIPYWIQGPEIIAFMLQAPG